MIGLSVLIARSRRMEMENPEQSLADIEKEFEEAKGARHNAVTMLNAARGKKHMELMAKREAGQNLTQSDIKAMIDASIDTEEFMRERYMEFVKADSHYRHCKVKFDEAVRDYWSRKGK
jgi:hypothetical protein